jgi:L-iditol 2-dehydrogenase
MAKQFGAHYTIDAKEDVVQRLKEINEDRLADRIIVCSGSTQAAMTSLDCVDKGGTILFFAVPEPTIKLPLPITQFWRNEITIKTSYGAVPTDLNEAFTLLSEKRITVEDMITHRLSLQDAAEGFRLTAEAGDSLKVILKPN